MYTLFYIGSTFEECNYSVHNQISRKNCMFSEVNKRRHCKSDHAMSAVMFYYVHTSVLTVHCCFICALPDLLILDSTAELLVL